MQGEPRAGGRGALASHEGRLEAYRLSFLQVMISPDLS
jgi:hypothetical protein